MKTVTKFFAILFLVLIVVSMESFKLPDFCTDQFEANLAKADTEYHNDVTRCSSATFSSMCLREADLSYEKNVSGAVYTFSSCVNSGKD